MFALLIGEPKRILDSLQKIRVHADIVDSRTSDQSKMVLCSDIQELQKLPSYSGILIGHARFRGEVDGTRNKMFRITEWQAKLPSAEGSFFGLAADDKGVFFATDRLASRKVYYTTTNVGVLVSDDLTFILRFLKKIGERVQFEPFAVAYFLVNRYTPGNHSLFSSIYKLAPASVLRIDFCDCNVTLERYWKPTIAQRGVDFGDLFAKIVHEAVHEEEEVICEFSGGLDSTVLLAEMLRQTQKRKVTAVTGVIKGISDLWTNRQDAEYARRVATDIGAEHRLITLDIRSDEIKTIWPELVREMGCDSHAGLLMYKLSAAIKEEFGSVLIANGQNADTVLNLGSSADLGVRLFRKPHVSGHGNLLKRFLHAADLGDPVSSALRFVFWKGICKRTEVSCEGKIDSNLLYSLAFSSRKLPGIERSWLGCVVQEPSRLVEWFDEKYIEPLSAEIQGTIPQRMLWLLMNGFLQGSDARIVTESCNANNHSSFLPFADGRLLEYSFHMRRGLDYVCRAKYPLKDIAKGLGVPDYVIRRKPLKRIDPISSLYRALLVSSPLQQRAKGLLEAFIPSRWMNEDYFNIQQIASQRGSYLSGVETDLDWGLLFRLVWIAELMEQGNLL